MRDMALVKGATLIAELAGPRASPIRASSIPSKTWVAAVKARVFGSGADWLIGVAAAAVWLRISWLRLVRSGQ
jgi:hypothetical protein